MTLGNMRTNGVAPLAWRLGRGCNHFGVLDVSAYAEDVPGDLTPMAQSDPQNPSFSS
jgi:hypothetical protein